MVLIIVVLVVELWLGWFLVRWEGPESGSGEEGGGCTEGWWRVRELRRRVTEGRSGVYCGIKVKAIRCVEKMRKVTKGDWKSLFWMCVLILAFLLCLSSWFVLFLFFFFLLI
ncbi:hypothetical protein LINPERPRIM_LOCUS15282 [Linum perenne]